jgi:hypothetical protein
MNKVSTRKTNLTLMLTERGSDQPLSFPDLKRVRTLTEPEEISVSDVHLEIRFSF